MNDELLKQLVNFKLSLAHKAVERLPELIQKPVKDFESQIMQVLYDISKERVEGSSICENSQTSGLKQIDVE